MLQFLSVNVQIVNAALNAAMTLIWLVYLQIFLVSHMRQARSVIHIDLSDAGGSRSRCLVTNLSSTPVYVQGIAADLARNGHTSRMAVTERDEINPDDVSEPLARTNRGTLQSGETVDIGSLDDLIRRVKVRLDEDWTFDDLDAVTITVVAISGQAERVIGAAKQFSIKRDDKGICFSPHSILTQQIRPRQTREEFNSLLREQRYH